MALPGMFKAARMSDATAGDQIDNNVGDLESQICDALGFTIDDDITESPLQCDNAGRITKALLRLVAAGPVGIRFRDSTSGKEFRLCLSGTDILIDENTGSEGTPTWTNRLTLAVGTGDVDVTGTLDVTGVATLLDALSVTGAVTLLDALDVTGAITEDGDQVWHVGNHGAGSGLDADKLDGLEATAFARVDYIKVADVKATGTPGGSFVAGAWRTRVINIEETDTEDHCSIDSNQITLDAGTYDVFIRCPAFGVHQHVARLWQTSGTPAMLLLGGSSYSPPTIAPTAYGGQNDSIIHGRIVLTESVTIEIQHYCLTSGPTNGFGVEIDIGTAEVYTTAEFRKVA